jgi:hypothetical protein
MKLVTVNKSKTSVLIKKGKSWTCDGIYDVCPRILLLAHVRTVATLVDLLVVLCRSGFTGICNTSDAAVPAAEFNLCPALRSAIARSDITYCVVQLCVHVNDNWSSIKTGDLLTS